VTTAVAVRRRAHELSSGDDPARAAVSARAWFVDELAALALPFDADRVATAIPAMTFVVLVLATSVLGAVGGLGAVTAMVGVVAVLRRGAPRRRAAATERALPGVLDAVARHLRAGGSLAQAITAVRPPPSAPDLLAQWDRLAALTPAVGATAALEDWSASVARSSAGSRSVRLSAAALALAAATGGSPARAIDGVAATLRSRLSVGDEIRALSSQARASAVVIALAPVVFGILAGATDGRTRAFLASPAGAFLLVLGLVLDGVGAWWMGRLCRPGGP
jgi:tight adherence protein B